jgi:2-polyprenyl-6-methoxyphenol hydroxylase-like FAD-dependent oxidoreductase
MKPQALIVGAGPVGLTMAAELARYGVSVRIVDKAAARTDKSKALVLWSRTLELIDRMGCGASFVDAGLKVRGANIIAGVTGIAHIGFDGLETPHPYGLMLPQSETERLMEQHLNSFGVEVERRVELIRFVADEDAVTAFLRRPDGSEETLDVDWMIGCDGAHSVVRHGLGMEFEGDTLVSHWILADLHLAGPAPPDEIAIYWHADGILLLFPITPGRYRVIADVGEVKAGEHPSDPTLEEVQSLIDQRGPRGIKASAPIWLSPFTINERKVTEYRAERVFLAGDAAHIHSPAGGQGMNTGMQDAINLAWKLALVCRGLANPEPMLASYSSERSEIGREVLLAAGRLTTIATLRGGLAQSIRNHLAPLLFGLTPVRRAVTDAMSELSIGYPNGPLTSTGGHSHSGPAAGARAPVSAAGHRVGSGDRPRFAIFAVADEGSTALIARYADLLEAETRAAFADDGIWLVRPDGYVAMTAQRGDWDRVGAYLDWVTGARGADDGP